MHEILSDDEVDLPKDLKNSALDDNEDEDEDEVPTPFGEEKWNDLALDRFVQHLGESETNSSMHPSTAGQALAAAMQALRGGNDSLPQENINNISARSDGD